MVRDIPDDLEDQSGYAGTSWPCCGQELQYISGQDIDSCTVKTVEIPGAESDKTLPSVPYEPEYGGPTQRCHDCGVARGGYHHPGCDMERCPRCGGQLIVCGCLSDEAYDAWQRVRGERDAMQVERDALRAAMERVVQIADRGATPEQIGRYAFDALNVKQGAMSE